MHRAHVEALRLRLPVAVLLSALFVFPAAVAVEHPVFVSPSRVYGAWLHERVDPAVRAPFSVEFDAQGRMHAAWLHFEPDYRSSSLRYGIREEVEWSYIDVPGHQRPTSMALTSSGEARAVVFGLPEERVYYYEFDARGGWTRELLEGARDGAFSHLALDDEDQPHIVYSSWSALRYATKNVDGVWFHETVVEPALSSWNAITLGADGTVHIFYTLTGTTGYGSLGHAHRVADGTWVHETVDALGGTDQSATIDKDGRVHVAYQGYGEVLRYGVLEDGVWYLETVDHDAPTGGETSIEVDSHGQPHIAYYQLLNRANPEDPLRSHVKYATKRGDSEWVTEFLHPTHAANFPALQLDAHDMPHILYLDWYALVTGEPHYSLMYARPVAAAAEHAIAPEEPLGLLR